jgi:hypothetical protein
VSGSIPSNAVQANGVGAVSDDQLNTFMQTDQTATQLRNFVGISGMAVMLQGISAPGDGGAGLFYWNLGTYTDNNSSVIVPPGAVGQGAWLRSPLGNADTSKVRMQLQWVTGAIVIDGTVWFCFDPPYDGTINSLTYFTGNDSFDVSVEIAGTPVTGLSSVAVSSSTPSTTDATGDNVFLAGNPVTGVISGTTGSPTDALLSLNVTWTS